MHDTELNVHTYDFGFRSFVFECDNLPGSPADALPPEEQIAAAETHFNTRQVAQFIRDVLGQDGLDRRGGGYTSTVNCTYAGQLSSPEWLNAAWLPRLGQVVYGQRRVDGILLSYGSIISIVAHELFHGVTDHTARLQSLGQSGALNESYSDIFAVLVSNYAERNIENWNWQIGEPMNDSGLPIRDLSNPERYGQPAHMQNYVNTTSNQGGVHINNGIHNKAAYILLTAQDQNGQYLFDVEEGAALFYGALLQLSSIAGFDDSRRALLLRGNTLFRTDPQREKKLRAISNAFDQVGIV